MTTPKKVKRNIIVVQRHGDNTIYLKIYSLGKSRE